MRSCRRAAWLAGALVAAAACAGSPGPTVPGTAAASAGETLLARVEHPGQLGSEGETFELVPTGALPTVLDRFEKGSEEAPPLRLRLSLEATPGSAAELGVRVFLGHPSAERSTSIEDPSYVGSFTFYGSAGEGGAAGTFLLDPEPALRHLFSLQEGTSEDRLPLTLAPVPLRAEDPLGGLTLTLTSAELTTASG